MKITPLKKRSIIEASGKDVIDFLQGMMTINVESLNPNEALWGGILSPQGKYLFDAFLYYQGDDTILLDVAHLQATDLINHLRKYVLRREVALKLSDDYQVIALWKRQKDEWDLGEAETNIEYLKELDIYPVWFEKYQIVLDPRNKNLGYRWIGKKEKADDFLHNYGASIVPLEEYYAWRIRNAICEPVEDMAGQDFFFPEIGAGEMNGIDYKKGCYVGQEVTARIKHKGELKKQVIPVRVMGCPDLPALLQTDMYEIGTLIAYSGSYGLAYVRVDRWEQSVTTLRSITAGTSIISKAVA